MTDSDPLAQRIDTLEIRLAYQDQTIEDLNAALTAQWKLIEDLERRIAKLSDQVREIESDHSADPQSEPPPPHY